MRCPLRRWILEGDQEDIAAQRVDEGSPSASLTYAPRAATMRQRDEDASAARAQVAAAVPAAPRPAGSPQALVGSSVPSLLFNNFDRQFLDLGEIASRGLVLYLYPGCGHSPSDGSQSLEADALQHMTYSSLRQRFAEVMPNGALVALSSISPTQQFKHAPELAWDQGEGAPYRHYLVSDEMLQLAEELGMPAFEREGRSFYERLTLIARNGRIERVFHPARAGHDARQVLAWLQLH